MKKVIKNIIIGIIVVIIAIIITFVLRKYIFRFDKNLTKEQKAIIEKYISDKSNSYLEENMTFTSTHYFGDRYNDDQLEVYLWAMFSEYDTKDNKFESYTESSMPWVIIVNTKDEQFEIIDYKMPKDGNQYKQSIKNMFPIAIRGQVLNFYNRSDYKKLVKEHQNMIQIYEDYSKESE